MNDVVLQIRIPDSTHQVQKVQSTRCHQEFAMVTSIQAIPSSHHFLFHHTANSDQVPEFKKVEIVSLPLLLYSIVPMCSLLFDLMNCGRCQNFSHSTLSLLVRMLFWLFIGSISSSSWAPILSSLSLRPSPSSRYILRLLNSQIVFLDNALCTTADIALDVAGSVLH